MWVWEENKYNSQCVQVPNISNECTHGLHLHKLLLRITTLQELHTCTMDHRVGMMCRSFTCRDALGIDVKLCGRLSMALYIYTIYDSTLNYNYICICMPVYLQHSISLRRYEQWHWVWMRYGRRQLLYMWRVVRHLNDFLPSYFGVQIQGSASFLVRHGHVTLLYTHLGQSVTQRYSLRVGIAGTGQVRCRHTL